MNVLQADLFPVKVYVVAFIWLGSSLNMAGLILYEHVWGQTLEDTAEIQPREYFGLVHYGPFVAGTALWLHGNWIPWT